MSTETLADALPKEMARVREILGHYRAIGPAGMFGAAMIEQDLRDADRAVMSGDAGYQWEADVWLIDGVRVSGQSIRRLAKSQGEVYRVTRTGDVLTFEKVSAQTPTLI